MKQYETVIIINPVLSEDQNKKTLDKYRKFLKSNGAEILHEHNWGLRQLAYPIKAKNNGYYYIYEYKAEGDVISKLEIEYKRDENILRFLTVALDKHGIAFNEYRRNRDGITVKKEEKESTSKVEEAATVAG